MINKISAQMIFILQNLINKKIEWLSVVDGTIIFTSEPFHSFFFVDSVLGTDSWFASSSKADSVSWSFQDDVEVHTEDTGVRIILNTEVDVFLNTEAEVSSVREVCFSQFSILNF